MRKSTVHGLLAAAILGLASAGAREAAAETVLTFDSQSTGAYSTLTESGYKLEWIGFGDLQAVVEVDGHGNALSDSNPFNSSGAQIVLTRADGGAFNLNSFAIADLASTATDGGYEVVGIGASFRVQITASNGVQAAYRPTSGAFATVLTPGVANVTYATINIVSSSSLQRIFAVDDIHVEAVAAVPEPSSLVMAGLAGTIGLGAALRRRAA